MNRFFLHWVLAMVLMVFPAVGAEVDVGDSAGEDSPADPIDYIRRSLQAYPIVCLGEGGHQAKEPHRFLRRVLGDKTILEKVDVVIDNYGPGVLERLGFGYEDLARINPRIIQCSINCQAIVGLHPILKNIIVQFSLSIFNIEPNPHG